MRVEAERKEEVELAGRAGLAAGGAAEVGRAVVGRDRVLARETAGAPGALAPVPRGVAGLAGLAFAEDGLQAGGLGAGLGVSH